MKTNIVMMSFVVILLFSCTKATKADVQAQIKVATSSGNAIGSKKYFVPYSWQIKWFNDDLNDRLKFSGKGC